MLTTIQALMIVSMTMLIAGMINGRKEHVSLFGGFFTSAPFYIVSFYVLDKSPIGPSNGYILNTFLSLCIIVISATIGEVLTKKSNTM